MLALFWFTFLYQPLFNALVWIYVNIADQNLGWAVVWLTVFLRILLLPLSILSARNVKRREQAQLKAEQATKDFKSDPIARKEAVRRIMRQYNISPWAQVLSLGIQLLVLVLLYQVFITGIEGRKVVATLYESINYPGKLDVIFHGFDIGRRHDYFWAGLTSLYLFLSIFISNWNQKWTTAKATFLFLFPLFTFGALWWLPMVKSLFILTSMIFSDIIQLVIWPFKKIKDNA
ncbi:MAG: hypothetical protein COU31_03320 [Candidatus Magasanikbacteria bacterium CG10_big_fil_rev_8_21_14_0_10_40_10]|uniref:Membrane insertase YidC/Oxa/ALB C-terminal domain-containing protein n=1 Tax=Candidatus Magasanikbacteria bacterium CG10_big_fil_rev_8_21_14_0_10_40_10 TaxID=1974648 RepID=A0A2M6W3H6_9BACT|nr:MAG: hypothetical protein COU31_03320 [Candidatus Magasanikbacteria bacterium CG10_big_fil_rev_8_21_14_0_10_40_10]